MAETETVAVGVVDGGPVLGGFSKEKLIEFLLGQHLQRQIARVPKEIAVLLRPLATAVHRHKNWPFRVAAAFQVGDSRLDVAFGEAPFVHVDVLQGRDLLARSLLHAPHVLGVFAFGLVLHRYLHESQQILAAL